MGFQVQEDPWHIPRTEPRFYLGNNDGEVAEDSLVAGVANICWHKVGQGVFVDVAPIDCGLRTSVSLMCIQPSPGFIAWYCSNTSWEE